MQNFGFFRVAAGIPEVEVADTEKNAISIISQARQAAEAGCKVIVFPELSVTAYTCADLFRQSLLRQRTEEALFKIAADCADLDILIAVGAPLRNDGALYNCAAVIYGGNIIGVVPKTYIPNYSEFYEKRWFASGAEVLATEIEIGDIKVPFGPDLLFRTTDCIIGLEICEDLWVTNPPSSRLCLAGANLILNLSASDELIGKYDYLRSLIAQQSARCRCAYAYSSAGFGESSTDLVFAGHALIAEDGEILDSSERFSIEPQLAIADIDLDKLSHDRELTGSYHDCAIITGDISPVIIDFGVNELDETGPAELMRKVDPQPFVPSNFDQLNERCAEIVNIQALGLMRRLKFTHCRNLVIGISGGLDSTLALLIAVRAFDRLGIPRSGITGITMPGFGTTDRTHTNASDLMRLLGITSKEIPIGDAVMQHFADIEHDSTLHDVTYENSQARERTQILMDYANKCGGMVLGTGDLSELALGWCTYNGDQMSMYGVNAGVPKTLVKYLVSWFARNAESDELAGALADIVDTPISPELTPADSFGMIAQKTEDLVGPYELHDFFIYNAIRRGFSPKKIYYLAKIAFDDKYDSDTIRHWLKVFYRRFFSQQFKRSCMPDGPKVGSISLSPRGDWRMPSDASATIWLEECEEL